MVTQISLNLIVMHLLVYWLDTERIW